MTILIRLEETKDYAEVRVVNRSAFETRAEADLVDVLRKDAQPVISLVADEDGEIVGHILFSPVRLSGNPDLKIMGLGPMSVIPSHQRQGIGTALVRVGLEKCKALEYGAVVVLGHTWFYPRFGFSPSVNYGIRSAYEVPDEVFMVLEIEPGYLQGAAGTIKYHPAFNHL